MLLLAMIRGTAVVAGPPLGVGRGELYSAAAPAAAAPMSLPTADLGANWRNPCIHRPGQAGRRAGGGASRLAAIIMGRKASARGTSRRRQSLELLHPAGAWLTSSPSKASASWLTCLQVHVIVGGKLLAAPADLRQALPSIADQGGDLHALAAARYPTTRRLHPPEGAQ